ncbi:hypothetical protein AKUH4B114J_01430 [Apilactobacillus kunkeei]|uniref:hypothetical protein n=1 Tax=Apilactobacillus TaxID=2767877 RepID=UPI001C6F8ED2|nr:MULTISPECIES: hypothetical protein [Apilactobacillus]MBX8455023.1 hypothetical protein [Apilactobacillus kunkeei]MCK8618529.1 hypothetical protein [Apilactobacillus kunkeei]MDN2613469.1 hypothetical protein [Apilactobacillus sp. EABW-1NA]QYU54561.1 hypothetical protein K2W87_00675 [Apilactobacillus kunkeei]CAI2556372.1 hypothetical protein AKUH3B101X_01420 [Apilactobacillus kunkeei]
MLKKTFNWFSYGTILYLLLILLDSFVELLVHSQGSWGSLLGFSIIKLKGFLNFNIELDVKALLIFFVFIFVWTVSYIIYHFVAANEEQA